MRPIVPPPIVGLAAAGALWCAAAYLPALTIAFPGRMVLAAVCAGAGVLIEGMGAYGAALVTGFNGYGARDVVTLGID